MLNLVRMDFYRLFHSKALKVGLIAAAIIALFGMLLNLGILELVKFGFSSDPETASGVEFLFPIVSWLSGVDFADVALNMPSAKMVLFLTKPFSPMNS